MLDVLGDLDAYPARPQAEDGITYAPKIDNAETRLDFAQEAAQIERQIRAFNPPGAWFEYGGERIRVLSAARSDGRGVAGIVLDGELTSAVAVGASEPILGHRACPRKSAGTGKSG